MDQKIFNFGLTFENLEPLWNLKNCGKKYLLGFDYHNERIFFDSAKSTTPLLYQEHSKEHLDYIIKLILRLANLV